MHPFFKEFPFLSQPYKDQLIFWEKRPLMAKHNYFSDLEFVIAFMNDELGEMNKARGDGDVAHVIQEATDVVVVAKTAPQFLSRDEWRRGGSKIIKMVNEAIAGSGLNPEAFAHAVSRTIKEKNEVNHNPIFYGDLPGYVRPREIVSVYAGTRKDSRIMRYIHPEGILPNDLKFALSLGESLPYTPYGDSPFYLEALKIMANIEERRVSVL